MAQHNWVGRFLAHPPEGAKPPRNLSGREQVAGGLVRQVEVLNRERGAYCHLLWFGLWLEQPEELGAPSPPVGPGVLVPKADGLVRTLREKPLIFGVGGGGADRWSATFWSSNRSHKN